MMETKDSSLQECRGFVFDIYDDRVIDTVSKRGFRSIVVLPVTLHSRDCCGSLVHRHCKLVVECPLNCSKCAIHDECRSVNRHKGPTFIVST